MRKFMGSLSRYNAQFIHDHGTLWKTEGHMIESASDGIVHVFEDEWKFCFKECVLLSCVDDDHTMFTTHDFGWITGAMKLGAWDEIKISSYFLIESCYWYQSLKYHTRL